MSKTLLVVHHTPSPFCQAMFEAVLSGASDPQIEGVVFCEDEVGADGDGAVRQIAARHFGQLEIVAAGGQSDGKREVRPEVAVVVAAVAVGP